ncbi:MAG: hypothetical protein A2Z21_02345 [Candidatus Fraserbacteria bacterium RBG_16_55_9]|uniref:Uncharacterized protein n=1 Tax=Fraserbacteria sp. (strain RBG_16_55_9) TaxID=1817864 RepID=A0A1F5V1Q0_FRAXR|nr:MAG: hypothetical protein A2Z21_02345 [Candidatus Fraserbacteria bacterium RBG_16_55_9]
MVKWLSVVLGILLALLGIIWILQGVNVLGGSFMSGQPFWAAMGTVALVVGVSLVLLGKRRW